MNCKNETQTYTDTLFRGKEIDIIGNSDFQLEISFIQHKHICCMDIKQCGHFTLFPFPFPFESTFCTAEVEVHTDYKCTHHVTIIIWFGVEAHYLFILLRYLFDCAKWRTCELWICVGFSIRATKYTIIVIISRKNAVYRHNSSSKPKWFSLYSSFSPF